MGGEPALSPITELTCLSYGSEPVRGDEAEVIPGDEGTGTAAPEAAQTGWRDSSLPTSEAARKRAAVEMMARHEHSMRRTARRYSLGAEDAEDSYQRALEIVLTKAPTTDPRELIRWTHTVIKHEALAVRRGRERLLGRPVTGEEGEALDRVALIPADAAGPAERAERREEIARSREALKTLKPAELRALTLLAEGYSYAEIGELTGFSRTKINRCLAEGRERFRSFFARSEDGSRCRELQPLLSAFCDGEASAEETAVLREHLRVCGACRSTLRAYRAAPRAVAALAPGLPASRSLFERVQEVLAELGSRLPGGSGGAESAAAQVAAVGGASGAGMTGLAKMLTLCVGAAGSAAACMSAGVLPAPVDLLPGQQQRPVIEREAGPPVEVVGGTHDEPAPAPVDSTRAPAKPKQPSQTDTGDVAEAPASTGAVEYVAPAPEPPASPAPAPEPTPTAPPSEPSSASSGSPAGEFGP